MAAPSVSNLRLIVPLTHETMAGLKLHVDHCLVSSTSTCTCVDCNCIC